MEATHRQIYKLQWCRDETTALRKGRASTLRTWGVSLVMEEQIEADLVVGASSAIPRVSSEGAVSPGGFELRSGRTTADILGAWKKDVELREAAELRKQMEEEARKTQSTRERLEKELMYLKETKKRLDEEAENVNRARHGWDLATRTVTSRMASNLGTPSNIRGEYDFLSRGRGDRWSERPVAGFLSGYVDSPVSVTPTTCRPLSSTGIPELTLIRSTGSSVAGLAVESVGRATDSGLGTSVQLLSGGLLSGRAPAVVTVSSPTTCVTSAKAQRVDVSASTAEAAAVSVNVQATGGAEASHTVTSQSEVKQEEPLHGLIVRLEKALSEVNKGEAASSSRRSKTESRSKSPRHRSRLMSRDHHERGKHR